MTDAQMIRELEAVALATGTDNQRERWAANALPDDELLALVRAELFRPFDGVRRWTMILPGQTRHAPECPNWPNGAIRKAVEADYWFEGGTAPAPALSHDEWESIKQLRERAERASDHAWVRASGGAFTVAPRWHQATCRRCGEITKRNSAAITVTWAGRVLVREYSL
jgi:hypothetical protein